MRLWRRIMPQKKSERINLTVTPTMKERLSILAEEKDMTVPEFIRHCVNVYVAAYDKRAKKV